MSSLLVKNPIFQLLICLLIIFKFGSKFLIFDSFLSYLVLILLQTKLIRCIIRWIRKYLSFITLLGKMWLMISSWEIQLRLITFIKLSVSKFVVFYLCSVVLKGVVKMILALSLINLFSKSVPIFYSVKIIYWFW